MIDFFARHPTAANLLMIIFLVMGILTANRLQRETFPDFSSDEVRVQVLYPGATANEIEESICQRIEDAIDGVRFVKEVRSEARPGVGIVVAEMDPAGELITFKDEISTEVAAIDDFPEEIEEPIVSEMNTTDPVLSLLVAGPMSDADLKTYCEQLKRELQKLDRVSLVEVSGFSDRQFRVELSAEALLRNNVSVADVAEVISRQSVDLPAGEVETDARNIVVRFADQRTSVRALERLVVRAAPGGAELTIADLGTVIETFEIAEDKVLLNGRRAGILAIQKTKNQDTIRVATAVKEFVNRKRVEQPQVEFVISRDTSTLVQDRLQLLIKNGWQGALLVFCAMALFFNVRLSFWVVMSLPVSFLGAFFFLPFFGLTINMLTMVGLLLALGILMDDGIVIAENIASQHAAGKSPMEAAIGGTKQVGAGVFSSFITTVCVLGPLATLEGDIGKVLRVVPMVLILVLVISLVEAFMILPAHLGHSLGARKTVNPLRRRVEETVEWMREFLLGRAVDFTLRWRYACLGCVAAVFLGTIGFLRGGFVKFQAFPELDGDVMQCRILMPPGTPLERTEAVVDGIFAALDAVDARYSPEQPDGRALVQQAYAEFNVNADAFETGAHVATITADLLTADVRTGRIDTFLNAWREEAGAIPDALSIVYTEPTLGPAGRNLEVRVRGESLEALRVAGREMRDWLDSFVGVYNLSLDLRPGKPEYRIRLREGALGMGLDAASLARQLRSAFQGATADEVQIGLESYEIDVQLAREDQDNFSDLDYFHCTLPSGEAVSLGTVAKIEVERGWSRITRVDGIRTVTLRGDTDSTETNTAQVLERLRAEFVPELAARYPEVFVDFEGEAKEAATAQRSMVSNALVGLIGVFVLLSFQFRSYTEPLIVMAAIPLALVGVVGGHWLLGLDLSMPSMLGFVSLAGIVVNDSILLVIFLKMARAEGRDPQEAAAQASRQRFRAIMITSLTTIAGLLPLTFETSLQAQVLIPLAVSIVFGLLSSTLLVLLVIPSLYVVLSELGLAARMKRAE